MQRRKQTFTSLIGNENTFKFLILQQVLENHLTIKRRIFVWKTLNIFKNICDNIFINLWRVRVNCLFQSFILWQFLQDLEYFWSQCFSFLAGCVTTVCFIRKLILQRLSLLNFYLCRLILNQEKFSNIGKMTLFSLFGYNSDYIWSCCSLELFENVQWYFRYIPNFYISGK